MEGSLFKIDNWEIVKGIFIVWWQLTKALWPLLIIIVLVIAIKLVAKTLLKKQKSKPDLSAYERKPYIFDATSEFNLYKVLIELFGDKYFIFPQVNYNHLIQPRKTTWVEERKHRSRIDRKSVDFVFCDKERIVPQLIIELDGSVHNFGKKKERDEFIDELTKIVGLPILHLKTSNLDREFVRKEINQKLNSA